jgi:hypothetical protein
VSEWESVCVCVYVCVCHTHTHTHTHTHLAHKEGKGVIKGHESSKGIGSGVLKHWQGLGFRVSGLGCRV